MNKRPRDPAELDERLEEQLGFIERSAAAFDGGVESEAKRIAVSVRILVHDTERSTSLLVQLGRKNQRFFDSSIPSLPGNITTYGSIVGIRVEGSSARYVAMLDDLPPDCIKWTEFDDWWTAPIFVDRNGHLMSRKDIVLTCANQDGGAHVDPALDDRYAALSRDKSLGSSLVIDGQSKSIDGAESAALRQIGHEVLKTLRANYSKIPDRRRGFVTYGLSAEMRRAVPRNSPCPCGSNKRFKHCHGSFGGVLRSFP